MLVVVVAAVAVDVAVVVIVVFVAVVVVVVVVVVAVVVVGVAAVDAVADAFRLIQQTLNKLEWNDAGLRAACEARNPGADARKMTLATLTWTRKVTTRRQWFEKLAEDVAHPMGVALAANRAQGTFGRQISPGSARMPTVFSRRPSAGSKCPRATCGRRARLSIQELMRRRQPPWACKWEPLRMQSLMGILP